MEVKIHIKERFKYCLLIGIFFIKTLYTFAQGTCSSYSAHIKDAGLEDRVISGHVLKTITGVDFAECFQQCSQDCSCRSFNLGIEGNGVCELNDVDKEEAPRSLRVRKGFVHVSFQALTKVRQRTVPFTCLNVSNLL